MEKRLPTARHAPERRRLVLFARRPRLGRVKTRLVPGLSPERALELYRAFLADQLRFLRDFREEAQLLCCLDELPGGPEVPPDLPLRAQGTGSLGRRLARAFADAAAEGAAATVIIGSDSPTLPPAHVRRAFELLAGGVPAVVAPADDGGYVLIGVTRPQPALFEEIPWGTPEVLERTLDAARRARIELRLLEGWYDVDDAGSLERLRSELASPAARRRAPATTACLAGWGDARGS